MNRTWELGVSFEGGNTAHGREIPAKQGLALVGGAPVDPEDLSWAARHCPRFAAADGGAAALLDNGYTPEAVIGDMDSLPDALRDRIPADRLHHETDQNTTDFEKCLARLDASLIVGLGFLGARLDHSLAALSALVQSAAPCLLIGPEDAVLALPANRDVRIDLAPGTRVSLYPLAPVTGRSDGLRWPIDALRLSPMDRIGTSNEATGPVHLTADGPGLLLLLPKSRRDAALAALSSSAR